MCAAHASLFNLCCLDLGGLFQAKFLDGSLAQDELLHFPAACQRIGRHKLEIARNFLWTDLPFAVCSQFFLCNLLTLYGQDNREKFFAEEGIGDAEYLYIGNFRMANQELFDFAREEIFAATNDHLFQATDYVDIASRIHRRKVAGM